MITEKHFWWISLFRGREFRLGKQMEFHQLTLMRGSRESNQGGRGLTVKVNLLIFKDEKTKDAVNYHLWWWDIGIFCHLGWDDQHLLSYIFWSLQGSLETLPGI